MILGIPKEIFPKEKRVAIIPNQLIELKELGFEILVESKAGKEAGFLDETYKNKGAKIIQHRKEIFNSSDVILQVMGPGTIPYSENKDYDFMKKNQINIAFQESLTAKIAIEKLTKKYIKIFAMELIPRITRTQSMDALSSMANISGYKAILIAAEHIQKVIPMMTTAAGTIIAAKVLVIGAGVAGLQAISTARRLGAIVYAYDVRPIVKEQVESLGAKFVNMDLKIENSENKEGYANELTSNFYKKEQELITKILSKSDIVITTAVIPGKKAPILITNNMLKEMKIGSVIVDMAAERGGNCELSNIDKIIIKHGVKILAPVNIPSTISFHSSQMYSKNISTFLKLLVKNKKININLEDEIIDSTLVSSDGVIVNKKVKKFLEL